MAPRITMVVLVGLMSTAASAQLSSSDRAVIETYRVAVKSIESKSAGPSLEAAFSNLGAVRDVLMRMRDSNLTVLESLSDDEFRRLERTLPGVVINREETLFVEPDPDYFLKLATAHGDFADRQFFAALKATYPEAVWPVYLEQQTDYSGCTRFGEGKLGETYRLWSRFESKFPGRYVAAVQKETEAVVRALTESTCACGDATSVEQEMRRFLQAFPAASVRAAVSERLQRLREGRSDIRIRCVSG